MLAGKQLFYDARDPRLARDRYMSCASCHNDGGHDGRVWDLTGLGEGLRNTIALRGRAGMGQGFLHWSNNFDEVQDFEGQIRTLAGGTGLMTDAEFNTGTRSAAARRRRRPACQRRPRRAGGVRRLAEHLRAEPGAQPTARSLTADAAAGKTVFTSDELRAPATAARRSPTAARNTLGRHRHDQADERQAPVRRR